VFTTIHRERGLARRVFGDMTRCNALLVIFATAACSSKKPPHTPAQVVATPTNPPAGTAAQASQPPATTPNLAIDPKLAARCKLGLSNVEQAPKFAYNETDLLPADRDALIMIAECLVKGPLAGHDLRLVGRADPRGTDEYNLALGTRRADAVRQYLQRLGVPATQLEPTTRGEIDASGDDEPSWRRDRRVDLELAN
jgi:peptidoglycan-associated lipoprotein